MRGITSRSAGLLGIVFVLAASACGRVAPYERARLAHPNMTTSDVAGPGEEHMRSVQEGAMGGESGAGGGCGCN
jgi:hypothetical protein